MIRDRIHLINELALTFRSKQLPREHLARWLRSLSTYSAADTCGRLQQRERMPSLADALADLRSRNMALSTPGPRRGCSGCHGGYVSRVDEGGYAVAARCSCATASPQVV